jgi:hypothetical protein
MILSSKSSVSYLESSVSTILYPEGATVAFPFNRFFSPILATANPNS